MFVNNVKTAKEVFKDWEEVQRKENVLRQALALEHLEDSIYITCAPIQFHMQLPAKFGRKLFTDLLENVLTQKKAVEEKLLAL